MNGDIFANFICLHFNYCIDIVGFPQVFKHADVIPADNKKKKWQNSLQTCQHTTKPF